MADEASSISLSSFTSQNSLVIQLCRSRLVDTLRDNNSAARQRAETADSREVTVATAITRLFPSVDGGSSKHKQHPLLKFEPKSVE